MQSIIVFLIKYEQIKVTKKKIQCIYAVTAAFLISYPFLFPEVNKYSITCMKNDVVHCRM